MICTQFSNVECRASFAVVKLIRSVVVGGLFSAQLVVDLLDPVARAQDPELHNLVQQGMFDLSSALAIAIGDDCVANGGLRPRRRNWTRMPPLAVP